MNVGDAHVSSSPPNNSGMVAATGQPGKKLGEFGEAHFITLGPQGEIYVTDPVNASLQKFVTK